MTRKRDSNKLSGGTQVDATVSAPESRYNPNHEKEDLRQTIAANWELLRRSPVFQTDASQWVKNGVFRLEHALKQESYSTNIPARCALDWMLTPDQRYALACFQMKHARFKWDPSANFGPILVERNLERQETSLRNCIGGLFDVQRHPEPRGILRLDQPWPATPALFRDQFISIFNSPD